jgi:hypothetical protein
VPKNNIKVQMLNIKLTPFNFIFLVFQEKGPENPKFGREEVNKI